MKKKVDIFINSEDCGHSQYVEPHELKDLLESTKYLRGELALFVNGKCVHNGRLPERAIKEITNSLHYEIN